MNQGTERVAEFVELASPEERIDVVCEYTRRCYEAGLTVSVHAPQATDAEELDERLWTFAQSAFIPHVRLEQATDPLIEPVVILSGAPGEAESDILIVLTQGALPEWFERFPRLYDFAAVYDEKLRAASRERFEACRSAGYHMRFTRIKSEP